MVHTWKQKFYVLKKHIKCLKAVKCKIMKRMDSLMSATKWMQSCEDPIYVSLQKNWLKTGDASFSTDTPHAITYLKGSTVLPLGGICSQELDLRGTQSLCLLFSLQKRLCVILDADVSHILQDIHVSGRCKIPYACQHNITNVLCSLPQETRTWGKRNFQTHKLP